MNLQKAIILSDSQQKISIVAHRGASYAFPENTLISFQEAFSENADYIEGDFRMTKDGEIVCLHDINTSRIAPGYKSLNVRRSTFEELRRLSVSLSGKRTEGAEVKIPSLSEVLDMIPEGKGIFIEIKDYQLDFLLKLQEILFKAIFAKKITPEKIIVICFSKNIVKFSRIILPGIKVFWLFSNCFSLLHFFNPFVHRYIISVIKKIECDGIDLRYGKFFNNTLSQKLKNLNQEICMYGIDNSEDASAVRSLGAEYLTTDFPAKIHKFLNSAGK
ncbi:MAG: hypothetical protein K9I69_03900 [Ignavibacteriales bacterium]|nr:hypothetical protein [Ignavibacteriales bacterium]MCF8306695.1 hypothetical protein [Ignavibacteriales bacterium]MCF8316205.1 hypothetical protein [Ignavibacteriales bacterium]MCF8437789.1 hypothetical protein [Ignavibacteriales bacterium]